LSAKKLSLRCIFEVAYGRSFHGDNTGSNPVGDANRESASYVEFRRNFVGTKRHNFSPARGLLHCLIFGPKRCRIIVRL
jgi:hypothetical protein